MSCLIKQLTVGRLVKVNGDYNNDEHQFIATILVDSNDPSMNTYNDRVKALMKRGKKITPKLIRLKPDEDDFEVQMMAQIIGSEKIVFFAITDQTFSQSYSVQEFMEDYTGSFLELHKDGQILAANANGSVHEKSQDMFKQLCLNWGESKLTKVKQQVADVKNVMNESIQKQLENMENIDAIEVKADKMSSQASGFEKQSKQIKKNAIKKDWKSKAVLGAVCFVFSIFIIVIVAT